MKTLEILATILPDHPAAALLLVLGVVLFVVEFHAPTYGLLGIGGVASALAGLYMLVDAVGMDAAGLDPGLVYGLAALGVVMAAGSGWMGWRAARRRPSTGVESMRGAQAVVRSWTLTHGRVHIQGEDWAAVSDSDRPLDLHAGDPVQIVAVKDLTLRIAPLPRPT